MRDPNRLDDFYKEMGELHAKYLPDWRFGQLIQNFLGWHYQKYKTDVFYIEENKMLERFKAYISEMTGEVL